jgi:hypothetical protein
VSFSNYASYYANFYYAYNVAAGITVVTLALGTGNTTGESGLCASHYTGAPTSSPIDVATAFSSPSTTPWTSPSTGTLSNSTDLAVGWVMNGSNQCGPTETITSGPVATRGNYNGCSGSSGNYSDGILSTTSSVSFGGTTSGGLGSGNVAIIVTFK